MTYQGDYEDLITWITDTYPPKIYDTYYDWLRDVRIDFSKSGHHFSPDIADEMKGYWVDNNFGQIGAPKRRTEKYNYDVTYNSVNEKQVFTLRDAYSANASRVENYSNRKSFEGGIRRDISNLVKQGHISKLSKGVYKIND